jgi:hypothetical protein
MTPRQHVGTTVQAAEVIAEAMRSSLAELTAVMGRHAIALTEVAQALGDVAVAIERGGSSVAGALANDVAGAIGLCSDEMATPLDRIADALAKVAR